MLREKGKRGLDIWREGKRKVRRLKGWNTLEGIVKTEERVKGKSEEKKEGR